MTTLIIFIIILAILIFVHELGHFIAAKATGMRVDEFALGFPPKIYSKKVGETVYALNAIPFGGYVKIHGEDGVSEEEGADLSRSFARKPKWAQAVVLLSGVLGNLLLAWLLISVGFMSGLPTSASQAGDFPIENPRLVLTSVLPESPADEAGLKAGDEIKSIRLHDAIFTNFETVEKAQNVIAAGNTPLKITYERGSERGSTEVLPEEGIVAGKRAIGVSLDMIGTAKLPFLQAFSEGAKLTISLTGAIAVGLVTFIGQAFTGGAELAQVAGPVGIAGLVGDAANLGFVYLMSFTAFISINLVILNLIPFPALDGGRLLFVLIEKIKGSPIKTSVANWVNAIGFGILILLMILVTVNDVLRLF